MKMKIYVSFGQVHTHSVNGKTFDKDCLAEITCENYEHGRELAFSYFNGVFGTTYEEKDLPNILHYFPRGIIAV